MIEGKAMLVKKCLGCKFRYDAGESACPICGSKEYDPGKLAYTEVEIMNALNVIEVILFILFICGIFATIVYLCSTYSAFIH
jgi:hypothetical protein